MKLELIPVPVSDVDRSKAFYVDLLGFTADVDVTPQPGMRVLQLTPPGSACSLLMGTGMQGLTDALAPGALKGLHLVVDDLDAARAELVGRGVEVGEPYDVGGGVRYAEISDPDGNTLLLQVMPWRTGASY